MRQLPVEQVEAAFARVHITPQPPQLARLLSEVSQPFGSTPSQFAKPALQPRMPQVPPGHVDIAFGREHITPQPPQFAVLLSGVSQPFPSVPSQLPRPGLHAAIEHVPVAHVADAPAREQVVPHAPQSVTVRSDVSQPFDTRPSQSAKPVLHAMISQAPVEQLPAPFAGAQDTPHAPQLVVVFSVRSQPFDVRPSQLPNVGRHSKSVQAPTAQEAVALGNAQGTPHAPQFVSVRMFVSQPSAVDMLQSSVPDMQVVTRQVPVAQLPVPPAGAQTAPQVPQSVSVTSGVSQPLVALPSQSPHRGLHDSMRHVPVAQVEVAFGTPHTTPHAAQCEAVVSDCSQPFIGRPSQSPQPGAQVPMSQPATPQT